jgi:hypothetical protein
MTTYRKFTNEIEIIPVPRPNAGAHGARRKGLISAHSDQDQRRHQRRVRQRQAVELITAIVPPTQTNNPPHSAGVFAPNAGADEKTTAMDRARATVLRTLPMTSILLVLAIGLALWLTLSTGLALCIFAATAIAGYWLFNLTDYRYSRAGLERHRIDQASALSQAQMQHEKELRELALNGIIRQLEARPDDYE